PLLTVPVTFGAALWAARKAKTGAKLHGLLVGLIVAATGLIPGWPPNLIAVGASLLTLGAGWLGGWFGGWKADGKS
ncbi:MAG: hypothetical protein ACRDSJ_07490, partial [Rubrobacteraceae bacterium]